MILELAVQSIKTKLRLQSPTMLGNYEFYYAAGILCGKLKLLGAENKKPKELYDFIRAQTDGKVFDDSQIAHLVKMIYFYLPEEHYDAQMGRLFIMGRDGD